MGCFHRLKQHCFETCSRFENGMLNLSLRSPLSALSLILFHPFLPDEYPPPLNPLFAITIDIVVNWTGSSPASPFPFPAVPPHHLTITPALAATTNPSHSLTSQIAALASLPGVYRPDTSGTPSYTDAGIGVDGDGGVNPDIDAGFGFGDVYAGEGLGIGNGNRSEIAVGNGNADASAYAPAYGNPGGDGGDVVVGAVGGGEPPPPSYLIATSTPNSRRPSVDLNSGSSVGVGTGTAMAGSRSTSSSGLEHASNMNTGAHLPTQGQFQGQGQGQEGTSDRSRWTEFGGDDEE